VAPAPAPVQEAAIAPAPKAPPPWEAAAPAPAPEPDQDEPPSWVMEFSDDSAVAQDAPIAAPVAARVPPRPRPEYVIKPVPDLKWDGNWPALAAGLPLRGVSQQLAFQTELESCIVDGLVTTFRLRVPIDTLRASGNTEKLQAALQEHFADTKVHLEIDIGQVWYTASAEAIAFRAECQRVAEETVMNDAFVKDVMRDLGAFIVPGSVRPAVGAAAA
jgi:DNA polymerase-3 subunit gamma/tau